MIKSENTCKANTGDNKDFLNSNQEKQDTETDLNTQYYTKKSVFNNMSFPNMIQIYC